MYDLRMLAAVARSLTRPRSFADPTKMVTRSMRMFELVIGLLVLAVLGSFVALLAKVDPVWKDVFHGYVPGPGIVRGGGLYIAVGYALPLPPKRAGC